MVTQLTHTLSTIDPNEQAQRGADAAWESARWAFWTFITSGVMTLLTAGLLAGAIVAAWYAKKTWEATRDELGNSNTQLALAKEADLQAEALNVSTWLTLDRETLLVFVRNGNGGPVYDVHCRVWAKPDAANTSPKVEIHHWHQLAVAPAAADPGKDKRFELGPDAYVYGATLPGGERLTRNRTPDVKIESMQDWKIWDGNQSTTGLAVELNFRDSRGKHWARAWNGELTEDQGAAAAAG
ncbi:hypothetical protein [Paenarthrobacter sp. YJN-5]|uniref:hypothetical protein n=1 Tax=Paenarthrobacter sp. YJN-5 TaxID=2735316 RepID=UPI001878400F|nr:hypothetical protein [Paenarthrobacter sp. YJN-5]QOT19382.1 hypothetical protein HMI59_22270 [Paenarthrobacter sp. YJN-5]